MTEEGGFPARASGNDKREDGNDRSVIPEAVGIAVIPEAVVGEPLSGFPPTDCGNDGRRWIPGKGVRE